MKKFLIFAFLIRILFIFGPYHPDLGNHLDWGNRFWEYGPKNFYSASVWSVGWPNQPPGTIYLWAGVSKINDIVFSFFWWLNLKFPLFPSNIIPFLKVYLHPALVKLPSVLAEIGIGWIIFLLVSKYGDRKKALFSSALFLFNPAIIYNSAIWGQTDGIINFFALLSFYLALKNKHFLSLFIFCLSVYFKFSLIIFFPVLLIVFLKKEISLKKILVSGLIAVVIFIFISLPFSKGNPVLWIFNLYKDRIVGGQGNMLTANAYNLWAMIYGIDFSRTDQGIFLGLTYKWWGWIIFLIFSGSVLFQFFVKRLTSQSLLLTLSLISFSAFLFLTNMHERYLYPVFPYLAILVVLQAVPLWFYLVISCIHLLNLYNLWFYPEIPGLKEFLSYRIFLPCRLMSFILILLFLQLYSFLLRSKSGKIA